MIDADLIERFQRDGAVRIPQLFTAREIEDLRAGIDLNLAQLESPRQGREQPDDPGHFVEDFCNWRDNPHYRRFIFDSALAETAGRLMRSRTARLYHDHMLTKEPGTRQPTPWHQDQPYYNIEGRQNVSFWIPVDPVSRASTLEFIAGSHRGPWLMPRSFMDLAGQVVSRRHAGRSAGHRGAARRFSHSRLGARTRRCRVLSHAHPACRRRYRGQQTPARVLGAIPGRRHRSRAAPLEDIPGFSRLGRTSCPRGRP